MNIREWALIAFTILAQMSVGSFIVLGIVHFFATRKAGSEEADRLSDRALLAIGPTLLLGLAASLLHLGNPFNAYLAVSNLGSSWLSWEVLSGVLFAAVGGVFALMQWRKFASFAIRNIIAVVAAAVGLVLVYSMSNVYMLRTQPAWNTVLTPISFYTTTLLLGVLAMGAAFVANYAYVQLKNPGCADVQCVLLRDALRWFAITSIVLLGVELVVVPLQIANVAAGTTYAAQASAELYGQNGLLLGVRLALVFLGAGILGVFIYQNALSAGHEKVMGVLAYAAFALVLVSEVVGRFLFYATHARIGL
ncbi:MAG: dimethyl sulfoxide reductase anchor subunit [Chloroflexi bacterium]|nr:dimethyl sulfoxide reductase anchor subunit [Chloroflexota bacterium]